MIHEIDESLQKLVASSLNGAGVTVAFEAPTREWAAQRNGPAVNLYLYDVREDVGRRAAGREPVRDGGRVVGRKEPLRSYRLSYLVTAWTPRAQDEHRLLSLLLSCFLKAPILPKEVLPKDFDAQVQVSAALPTSGAISDIWSALGGELQPSLDVVLTVPFDTQRVEAAGPPLDTLVMTVEQTNGAARETTQRPR